MNQTKYNVRHVRCNMDDFHMDRHRFRFEYNGKEYIVPCYHAITVVFGDNENTIPEHVKEEIESIIWNKIDKEETTWRYPEGAYKIADAYAENEEMERE